MESRSQHASSEFFRFMKLIRVFFRKQDSSLQIQVERKFQPLKQLALNIKISACPRQQ